MGDKKIKNIRYNPRVSLVVDEYFEDWSRLKGLMIQGEASLIGNGEEYAFARKLLYEKYPPHMELYPIKEGGNMIIKVSPFKAVYWDEQGWQSFSD